MYEPNVMLEGNAQILTGTVYKMWYTAEWETPTINYAESADGLTWTKYGSNPVLADHNRGNVLRVGNTYHLYAYDPAAAQIDHYTSADGLSWTLSAAGVITRGAGGAWDDDAVANSFVWVEGATWYMIYDGKAGVASPWKMGLATSSDGDTWTKDAHNPVIDMSGTVGSPWVKKAGDGFYYLWCLGSYNTFLPTDIIRFRSADLIDWLYGGIMLARATADEGVDTAVGQLADPSIVEVGGVAKMFCAASSDGGDKNAGQHIKLFTAPASVLV